MAHESETLGTNALANLPCTGLSAAAGGPGGRAGKGAGVCQGRGPHLSHAGEHGYAIPARFAGARVADGQSAGPVGVLCCAP